MCVWTEELQSLKQSHGALTLSHLVLPHTLQSKKTPPACSGLIFFADPDTAGSLRAAPRKGFCSVWIVNELSKKIML